MVSISSIPHSVPVPLSPNLGNKTQYTDGKEKMFPFVC